MTHKKNGSYDLAASNQSAALQLDLPFFTALPPSAFPAVPTPLPSSLFHQSSATHGSPTLPTEDSLTAPALLKSPSTDKLLADLIPPSDKPLPPNTRSVQIGSQTLPYRLKRSTRRTIGFLIDDEGLAITAPKWVTVVEVESVIIQKQGWIFKKMGEWQARQAKHHIPPIQWVDGAQIPYLGGHVTLQIASETGSLHFDAEANILALGLVSNVNEQQIKDRVQSWLQQQAKQIFGERLEVYAEKLGVRFHTYRLSSANTRWGSCTEDGKIRLSWRLIHFTVSVIDYVVAHELAHLKEMNHGPRFWETVASVYPEFDAARDALKQHPPSLFPAF